MQVLTIMFLVGSIFTTVADFAAGSGLLLGGDTLTAGGALLADAADGDA